MEMPIFFKQPFWSQGLWGNTWLDYLNALVIFLSVCLIIKLIQAIAIKKFEQLSQKTKNAIDNRLIAALKTIKAPAIVMTALWVASRFLETSPIAEKIIHIALFLVLATSVIRIAEAIVKSLFGEIIQKNKQAKPLLHFFNIAIRVILWIVGLVFILSSLGINVSSLITGLGISGVILALALQNVILDLFSSLTLYLDKPIQVGDQISVGADSGVVRKIGIKSTRIQATDGHVIIIPNRNLTTTSINNFQTNNQRQLGCILTLPHSCSDEQCAKIISNIRQALTLIPQVKLEQVSISDLTDQGLKLNISYLVLVTETEADFWDTRQRVSLALRLAIKKTGVNLSPASKS